VISKENVTYLKTINAYWQKRSAVIPRQSNHWLYEYASIVYIREESI